MTLAGCGAALATLVPIALFQSGMIERLPDPPGGMFASERITGSKMAHPMGVPDSYLGLASYGVTMALLVMHGRSRTARQLLGWKLAADAGAAAFNAGRQVVVFRKLCSWCTGTSLVTAVMVWGGRRVVKDSVGRIL